ncbi:MAG: MFS transporter [Akkermansiaceae bacterium]|nr:MFS transporter [Akkermansiaceae bacterium]
MSSTSKNPIARYFSEFGILRDCGKDFWLTNFIQFFDGMAYFSLITVFVLFLKNYCGFKDADASYWVGMYTLFLSMFVLAVGAICDIIGLKKTYAIGFAVLILGRVIVGCGTDFGRVCLDMSQEDSRYIVMCGIAVMSFGSAFMSPCISTSIRRFTTLRSRATGFNFYYLFMNIGAILANIVLVDYLRAAFGPDRGLFWIVNFGTLSCVLGFIFTRFVNEDHYAVPEEKVSHQAAAARRPLTLICEVIKERPFQKLIVFLLLTLGVRLVFTLQFLVMPQYYTRMIGDDFGIGLINAINPVIIVLGLVAIIPVLNRFSTVNLMIYGMSISVFSLVFMAIPAEWYLVVPGIETLSQAYYVAIVAQILIFAFGELLFSPRFSEYVARVAPKDKVASYMSLSALPMFIAKPFNGVIGGILVTYLCYDGIAAKMVTGHIDFWSSPEFMWTLYLIMAVISPLAIIFTRSMFVSDDAPPADRRLSPETPEEETAAAR